MVHLTEPNGSLSQSLWKDSPPPGHQPTGVRGCAWPSAPRISIRQRLAQLRNLLSADPPHLVGRQRPSRLDGEGSAVGGVSQPEAADSIRFIFIMRARKHGTVRWSFVAHCILHCFKVIVSVGSTTNLRRDPVHLWSNGGARPEGRSLEFTLIGSPSRSASSAATCAAI